MAFPFSVYLAAFVASCITALAALPLWRAWCIRTGLVDDPGHRKIHDQPVPLAGGLAVMTGIVVPLLIATLLLASGDLSAAALGVTANRGNSPGLLRYGFERRGLELSGILVGALGMLILGVVDDKKELRPGVKFAGQFFIALLVAASGVRITLFVQSSAFHYAVTILWVLGVINAFNFMDNMNGLCGGLGAIGAGLFAILAARDGQYLVALIAFLACGALVGFLPYNFPRAHAFLGDAGSHLVGYLLAVLAILPHFYTQRHPRKWSVLIPLLVLAVPLLDMVRVVLVRWRLHRPFYVGDNNHMSHVLVRRGFSRTRAVLWLWAAAAVMGTLAFLA